MVYDRARQGLVLFGGVTGSCGPSSPHGCLNDTWEFDTASNTWALVHAGQGGPPRRSSFGMSYDSRRSRVVLFGGGTSEGQLDDTWEWDGSAWQRMTGGRHPRAARERPSRL